MQQHALPESVVALTTVLRKLPGIGPRSAERIALHLVQSDAETVRQLTEVITHAKQHVTLCRLCGALCEHEICGICSNPRRDVSLLCLVERPLDIITLEKSGMFNGKYHVLGGKISPMAGTGPEDLRIVELEERLKTEPVREIIIAIGSDVEGDATSTYLARRLARENLKVTRIAHGLPAGSGLEFADEVTLGRALEGRREL